MRPSSASPLPDEFLRAARGADGIWEGHNLEGTEVLGAYARSGVSGWTTFVGVPAEIVQAPLRRSLWTLLGLGAALILLSLLLARVFARRIAAPVQGLVDLAHDLARGEPVAAPSTGLAEIDRGGGALASASTELREREAALRASEARLWATQNNAAVGIAEVDRDGRFVSVNEARCKLTGHTREELIGQHFGHVTDPEILEHDLELFARQVAGELDTYTTDSKFRRKDGSGGWARVTSTAVRDADGTFLYAVRVVEDITERRQADKRQKLLIDELNHRVKNTLATVQSLAWQAARPGVPPQVAQERFQERLLALSRTHNLLNETHWEGASLRTILETELGPYATAAARIRLDGPEVHLDARPAVVLGMAFHELTTNAAKHGALSVASGRVQVDWKIDDRGAEAVLTIDWCELGGPALAGAAEPRLRLSPAAADHHPRTRRAARHPVRTRGRVLHHRRSARVDRTAGSLSRKVPKAVARGADRLSGSVPVAQAASARMRSSTAASCRTYGARRSRWRSSSLRITLCLSHSSASLFLMSATSLACTKSMSAKAARIDCSRGWRSGG